VCVCVRALKENPLELSVDAELGKHIFIYVCEHVVCVQKE